MNHTSFTLSSAAAAAVLAMSAAAPAGAVTRYRLTELAGPATPRVINNSGFIAGDASAFNSPGGIGVGGRLDNGSALIAGPTGYTTTYARGINSLGVVSLTFQGAQGSGLNDRAAVGLAGHNSINLDPLSGYAAAGALGIGLGQVAGYSLRSGSVAIDGVPSLRGAPRGTMQATRWDGLTAIALLNPLGNGSGNSIATAINEAGVVGGTALDDLNRQRALIWAANGNARLLGLQAGQANSLVRDINENGDAIGRTLGSSGLLATVWSGSHVYTLAGIGAFTDSTGRGLNDRGQAVGFAQDAASNLKGMFWSFNGSGYDSYSLDSLVVNLGGWQTGAPQSINDAGAIVGFGTRADGRQGSYLLTAVPEPATWATFITGFGLIGTMARRRRLVAA